MALPTLTQMTNIADLAAYKLEKADLAISAIRLVVDGQVDEVAYLTDAQRLAAIDALLERYEIAADAIGALALLNKGL